MRGISLICNVGGVERGIRISLGVVLIATGYLVSLPVWSSVVLYVIGAVSLITGAVQFCPISYLIGSNTCTPRTSGKE